MQLELKGKIVSSTGNECCQESQLFEISISTQIVVLIERDNNTMASIKWIREQARCEICDKVNIVSVVRSLRARSIQ